MLPSRLYTREKPACPSCSAILAPDSRPRADNDRRVLDRVNAARLGLIGIDALGVLRWLTAYSASLRASSKIAAACRIFEPPCKLSVVIHPTVGNLRKRRLMIRKANKSGQKYYPSSQSSSALVRVVVLRFTIELVQIKTQTVKLRQNKYLNNIVEQDHRAIKRLVSPGIDRRRRRSFNTARAFIKGIRSGCSLP